MPNFLHNLFFALLFGNGVFAQQHYLSDCFHGGVVGDGYTAWFLSGPGQVVLNIPLGSVVKRAILFSNLYKWTGNIMQAAPQSIIIDGQSVLLSESQLISSANVQSSINCEVSQIATDITNSFNPSIFSHIIDPGITQNPVDSPLFSDFYILVFYENPTFPVTCVDIFLRDSDSAPYVQYFLQHSNPLNSSSHIGIAPQTSSICNTPSDWYNLSINGTPVGSFGGEEDNTTVYCAGTYASFRYDNNTLFGVGNDTSDPFVNNLDALVEASSYYIPGSPFELEFQYAGNNFSTSNLINQIFLTYSTPCDTFSVTTTPDTTICYGETLQLSATGGNANATNTGYLWSPTTDLSCTDCPNPVFSGDSSRLYTVQIWNNDSCSVVRPIKINVRPQSAFAGATVTPSVCGTNNGVVHLQAAPSNGNATFFTINGGSPQTDNSFLNLGAGTYTFSYTDVYGCASKDTVVTVGEINPTASNFLLSPTSGANPLTVTVSNTSQNATDFEWYWNSNFEGNSLSQVLADSSGTHTITLIAWQYDPTCADTLTQTFVVYDSLVFSVPNVFTPNNDGINDFFTITFNQDVQVSYAILNRWGETIQADQLKATVNIPLVLWDGLDATEGVYFLELEVVDGLGVVHSHEGFVHLER